MRSSLVRFWLAVKVGSDPRLQWSINMRAAMKKNNNKKKQKKRRKLLRHNDTSTSMRKKWSMTGELAFEFRGIHRGDSITDFYFIKGPFQEIFGSLFRSESFFSFFFLRDSGWLRSAGSRADFGPISTGPPIRGECIQGAKKTDSPHCTRKLTVGKTTRAF